MVEFTARICINLPPRMLIERKKMSSCLKYNPHLKLVECREKGITMHTPVDQGSFQIFKHKKVRLSKWQKRQYPQRTIERYYMPSFQ